MRTIVYVGARKYVYEMRSIFEEKWLPISPGIEDAIVRGVNSGILKSRYEGKYQVFYNVETGNDEFRRY